MDIKFEAEIKQLEIARDDLKRRLEFIRDTQTALKVCGLVGATEVGPSLEDCWDGEFKKELLSCLATNCPLRLKFHRGWTGFPELSEWDQMKDFILPMFYEFK